MSTDYEMDTLIISPILHFKILSFAPQIPSDEYFLTFSKLIQKFETNSNKYLNKIYFSHSFLTIIQY